jgi:hypothetical protein
MTQNEGQGVKLTEDDFCDEGEGAECWNCGGEGVIYSCFEEYACLDPEGGCDACERRCEVCAPAGRAALEQPQ